MIILVPQLTSHKPVLNDCSCRTVSFLHGKGLYSDHNVTLVTKSSMDFDHKFKFCQKIMYFPKVSLVTLKLNSVISDYRNTKGIKNMQQKSLPKQ